MPKIQSATISSGLDWHTLPPELKRDISDRLPADVRARVAEVSRGWRHTALGPSFDRHARAIIAARENVAPGDLPTPVPGDATGVVAELQARGMSHAAMLVALHATCERLPTVDSDRASYGRLPGAVLASSAVVVPPQGEAQLMGYPNEEVQFALMSLDGTRRVPRTLTDKTRLPEPRVAVTNSMLFPGALDGGFLVRDASGHLFRFDGTTDAVTQLPGPFHFPDVEPGAVSAAMSRDGRYVAAAYPTSSGFSALRVHDTICRTTVTETPLPYMHFHEALSVDSNGTAMVGGIARLELKAGVDGRTAATSWTRPPQGFVAIQLSPDEHHVVSSNDNTGAIHLEHRRTGHGTTLLAPLTPQGKPCKATCCSVAFSPAMAMAAVIRDDGSLSVYDLLSVPEGTHELLPKLHMTLRDARGRTRFFNSAATWFDGDGGGVNAAYPAVNQSGDFFPETGLMHLRFH